MTACELLHCLFIFTTRV